jgi:hypothetical protein
MKTAARDPAMPVFNPAFAVFLRKQLLQAVEIYRHRGRALAELDDAALQQRFVEAFDAWCRGAADGALMLNDVNAEFLLRRKPAPLKTTTDRVAIVFDGNNGDGNPNLNRKPRVVVALGRWLFSPFIGAVLAATHEPDEVAASRDFRSMMDGVAQQR